MDNDRPSLDLRHFDDVCPDKNVPMIAVFTKFDQFKIDLEMKLEDEGRDPKELNAEAERIFNRYYLANLRGPPPFVRLERMHKPGQRCTELIEKTANALSGSVIALMLLAVQKDNLELNINQAVKRAYSAFEQGNGNTERIITICIEAFPSIWYSRRRDRDKDKDTIFSKLSSFLANPPLSIFRDDNMPHKLIAIILILEHACLSYASQSRPTRIEALDQAYSRYCASDVHNVARMRFLESPKKYSIPELTAFVLECRLR